MLANLLNIVSKMSFANWNLRNTWIIAKQKRATRLTLIIRLTIAAPQSLIAFFERAERLAKQDARARIRSSSGAFAGECAELPTEQHKLCTAARRSRGLGVQPIKRQAHIGFAQQNCLHLKVLDFWWQARKRRTGMRPHFKRFFRSMAQKDLLLSDACLPFCGHSLLFFFK